MDDRTLVIVSDDCGDISTRLMLNDDQVRFLNWLLDMGWLNADYKNFQIVDKSETPIIM